MKLFLDKNLGGYALTVNKDAAKKHVLTDYYPDAGKVEDSDETDNKKVLDAYQNR